MSVTKNAIREECLPEKHHRPVARAKISMKMTISSTRMPTTIPMMGPVPSSTDPVKSATINLSNSYMLTEMTIYAY
jgi:hypothetical protein